MLSNTFQHLCIFHIHIYAWKPFIEFETSHLKVFWNETIKKIEENLLEALCIGFCERLFTIEEKFWAELTLFGERAGIRRFERMAR